MLRMSAAAAPPLAAGRVVAVNGGHTAWPAAESRLTLGLSPWNRYRVRPLASTRVLPAGVWAKEIAEPAFALFWAPLVVPLLVAAITMTIARTARIRMGNASRIRVIGQLLCCRRPNPTRLIASGPNGTMDLR